MNKNPIHVLYAHLIPLIVIVAGVPQHRNASMLKKAKPIAQQMPSIMAITESAANQFLHQCQFGQSMLQILLSVHLSPAHGAKTAFPRTQICNADGVELHMSASQDMLMVLSIFSVNLDGLSPSMTSA